MTLHLRLLLQPIPARCHQRVLLGPSSATPLTRQPTVVRWCGLLCVFLVSGPNLAESSGREPALRFEKTIHIPDLSRPQLVRFALGEEILAVTHDGNPDIRVYDSRETPVPHFVRQVVRHEARQVSRRLRGKILSTTPPEGPPSEVVVVFPEDSPSITGLRIVSRAEEFQWLVTVEREAADGSWEMVVENQLIFDRTRWVEFRSVEIAFDAMNSRRFRLTFGDASFERIEELDLLAGQLHRRRRWSMAMAPPNPALADPTMANAVISTVDDKPDSDIGPAEFSIDRVDALYLVESPDEVTPVTQTYPLRQFEKTGSPDLDRTVLRIQSTRCPLTSFTLVTDDQDFIRQTRVRAPLDHATGFGWKNLANGIVCRLDLGTVQRDELTVSFPEMRSVEYILVIHDGNGIPLNVTDLVAEGNVYELLFVAHPGQQYSVRYGGDENVESSRDDVSGILAQLTAGIQPVDVSVGLQRSLSLPEGIDTGSVGKLLTDTRVLLALLVVLVIGLVIGLYAANQRIERLNEE